MQLLCRVCLHIYGAFLLCIPLVRCGWRCRSVQTGMHLFFCGVSHNSKGNNHSMKPLFLLSSLFLSLSLFSAEIIGKVVGVSDGDTITVLDEMDKGNFKIRLDKIDAPEKKQAFGSKAKQFLSALIFGKQVTVRYKAVDRYGRIVGVVYCDGVEINLVMVQNGYAWHYCHYDKTPEYIQAEKQARADKKGLWADPAPVNPYEFRKQKRRQTCRNGCPPPAGKYRAR